MAGHDDLDEHFHNHPQLRKYAEMFDAQANRAVARQQRLAWIALLVMAGALWYWMFRQTGNWNPLMWKGFFGH